MQASTYNRTSEVMVHQKKTIYGLQGSLVATVARKNGIRADAEANLKILCEFWNPNSSRGILPKKIVFPKLRGLSCLYLA